MKVNQYSVYCSCGDRGNYQLEYSLCKATFWSFSTSTRKATRRSVALHYHMLKKCTWDFGMHDCASFTRTLGDTIAIA